MFDRCRRPLSALLLTVAIPAFAADKAKTKPSNEDASPSYEQAQPSTRKSRPRQCISASARRGWQHSQVMEYASALDDDIGPRLTGSPNMEQANEWTRDQLTAMGCENAHLEDWGEFGMGWQQLNTWVRMTSPDTAVFIAQAAPWSPSTNGAVSGQAVYVDIQRREGLRQVQGQACRQDCIAGRDARSAAGRKAALDATR